MAADAITLIEEDHRALEALFAQVTAGQGNRTVLLEEITTRLTAHARAEEAEVYPALEQAESGEDEEVEHAHDEHHEAEHLLRKARNLTASPHFEEAFEAFVAAVAHHVEEEERELLPALRSAVDTATLEKLGAAFDTARAELLGAYEPPTPAEAPDATSPGTPVADDLEEATKAELYEKAKQADIPGRSTMTKDELSEALRGNA
jgi:hemerythrin superfamily protein